MEPRKKTKMDILYQEKKRKRKVNINLEQTVSKKTRNLLHGSQSHSLCHLCKDYIKSKNEQLTIPSCTHSFCKDCIKSYVAANLMKARNVTAKYISCPYRSCRGVLGPSGCVDVVPQEVLDRWETALCEGLLLANHKNYFSPFNDGVALIVNHGKEVVVMVQCPFCQRIFRAQSRIAWHGGITDCKKFKIRLDGGEKDHWERMLECAVAGKTKWSSCPDCSSFVASAFDDNYMLCWCGHEFCYYCREEWSQNHGCFREEEETSSSLEAIRDLEFWRDMKLLFLPPTSSSPSIHMDGSLAKREVTAEEIQALGQFMSEHKDEKLSEVIEGGYLEHLETCLKVITLARNPPAHLAELANELDPQLLVLVKRFHAAKSSLSRSQSEMDAQKARFVAVEDAIKEWETLVEKEKIIAEDLTATEAAAHRLIAQMEMRKEMLKHLRAQKNKLKVLGTQLKEAIHTNLGVEMTAKFNKKEAEARKFEASPASDALTTLSLPSAQVPNSAIFELAELDVELKLGRKKNMMSRKGDAADTGN